MYSRRLRRRRYLNSKKHRGRNINRLRRRLRRGRKIRY